MSNDELQLLINSLRSADRRQLAKAISLVESSREEDASDREQLLEAIRPLTGNARRIAVTGAPGVGKSTLIEACGMELVRRGHRVAVLAVDPSSARSGGSILGDKVRMPDLARSVHAYVRPSPSGDAKGGTAHRTREVIAVCEAAGYDTVIVETVGVGQSEFGVADMVDLFILLLLPTAGDDVQAVKRGIMEIADVFVLTKSDLSQAHTNIAASSLRGVLSLLRSRFREWSATIVSTSATTVSTAATTGAGIAELCDTIASFFERCADSIQTQRRAQALTYFHELVQQEALQRFLSTVASSEQYEQLERRVVQGELSARQAVLTLTQHTTDSH